MDCDLVAVHTGQRHLTQPVAVLETSPTWFSQPGADARPLGPQLRNVHDLRLYSRGQFAFDKPLPDANTQPYHNGLVAVARP